MIEYQTEGESVYVCDLCKKRMITPHDKSIKDASWMAIEMNGGGYTHVCPLCREDFREADQSQVNGYSDPNPVIEAAKRALSAFAWLERHDGFDHHSQAVTDLRDALAEYDNE